MAQGGPLYARVMGEAWAGVAEALRGAHQPDPIVRAHGCFRVRRGRSPIALLVAWLLRLPRTGAAADVRLTVIARGDEEVWERTFDGRQFVTRQYQSSEYGLAERFGLLEFRYRLDRSAGGLLYLQDRTAVVLRSMRLALPARLAPRVEAREYAAGTNQVNVSVRITLPGAGLLIAYDGTIVVEDRHP